MKKVLIVALLVFLIPIFSISAHAAGTVGVSPGNIIFKDVLRNGYAEKYATITIDSEEPVGVNLESRGDIGTWLDFPDNLTVSRNNPGRVLISITPPADVPNGNYTGFIRIETESLGSGSVEGHAVSAVKAVLDIAITAEVTDIEILECQATNFNVHSAEKGDRVKFDVNILNQGNIRLRPEVSVEIWDQEQISILETPEFVGDEILPTTEKSLSFYSPTDSLPLGQYWANINVPSCFASQTLTFDVLEPGALKAEGILVRIASKALAEVDETVPIVANFKNIGEKDVEARFKGQITRDGKITQILESEEINVPIEQTANFTFFFTPQKTGKYIISGKVFYDKKITYESSTTVNVSPPRFGLKQAILIIVYILTTCVIVVLFYKIRTEKKRYLEKIRRIKYEN